LDKLIYFLRIASVVGARPNFIKMAPVYRALKGFADHSIIHTGQHYDYRLSKIFFKEFNLPDPDFELGVGSGLPGYQIGEMIKRLEDVFFSHREHNRLANRPVGSKLDNPPIRYAKRKPQFDLVLVYGDTNSTFAGALAAMRSGIKVAHIESGLRSFDRRMPEEINRILTDQLSDYLFAPTKTAMANLKREHVHGKPIFSGDLSVEIVNEAVQISKNKSKILRRLALDPQSYTLFTMHRAENTNSVGTLTSVIETFELLSKTSASNEDEVNSNAIIVYPIHPGTKRKFKENALYKRLENCSNLRLINPVGYIDLIQLLRNARKITTDSGGIQKEAYILGVPCITIRENTEWVETVKEGCNKLIDINPSNIVKSILQWSPRTALSKALSNESNPTILSQYNSGKIKQIFGTGNTSAVIKKFILSLRT
jgi:UDP-GlcNAc3NAcA epimerase